MRTIEDINFNTGKDHIVKDMVLKTGLSEKKVISLYENFNVNNQGYKQINESFEALIKPAILDYQKVSETILGYFNIINDESLTVEEKMENSSSLLTYIEEISNESDIFSAIQIIGLILSNVTNSNFVELNENMNIDVMDKPSSPELKPLFESLRMLLAKNNYRWGNNFRLENSYKSMMEYLENEISIITNEKNMYSVNEKSHMDIINNLLFDKYVNPLYLSADNLKNFVSDIQTLVFDLVLLINSYVSSEKWVTEQLHRNASIDYIKSLDNFLMLISSSAKNSIIIDKNYEMDEYPKPMKTNNLVNGYVIDEEKFRNYHHIQINSKSALNMLTVLKACANDFPLKIRRPFNNYITKALELVINMEKIQLKSLALNKKI